MRNDLPCFQVWKRNITSMAAVPAGVGVVADTEAVDTEVTDLGEATHHSPRTFMAPLNTLITDIRNSVVDTVADMDMVEVDTAEADMVEADTAAVVAGDGQAVVGAGK